MTRRKCLSGSRLEAVLRAGYGSASLYGFAKAGEDYNRLMSDPDLSKVREDAKFKAGPDTNCFSSSIFSSIFELFVPETTHSRNFLPLTHLARIRIASEICSS